MDIITHGEFNAICYHPSIVTLKTTGINFPKVLEQPNDNSIIKIFHRKKTWLTSDRIWPRAQLFYNNIQKLKKNGFNVPIVTKFQYCQQDKIHLIHYKKISGTDIRSITQNGNLSVLTDVAKLLANLHQKGIFFRSIHLGNLVLQPDNTLALIDICDVRYRLWPLTLSTRYRNLKHLLNHIEDTNVWKKFTLDAFLNEYLKSASLSILSQKLLTLFLKRNLKNVLKYDG